VRAHRRAFANVHNALEDRRLQQRVELAEFKFFQKAGAILGAEHHARTLFANALQDGQTVTEVPSMVDRQLQLNVTEMACTIGQFLSV
jgi:hypothetical protein